MMALWQRPGPRRAIFLLVNIAACVSVFVLVVLPIRTVFVERDDFIADKRKTIARLAAIAAQETNVRAFEIELVGQLKVGEFLSGPNENVINADLQTRLKAIAESVGARSRAVQSLPSRTKDQIRYSGSRIEIYGPLRAIQQAIFDVENAKPYLFIASAALKSLPTIRGSAAPEEPIIQAQLDIFGALQIEPGGP